MSPKTQEFYNKLLAFYLDDNSVVSRLENSYKYFLRIDRKLFFSNLPLLEGSQRDLETYFPRLLDAEISEVIKTFKMRMFPAPEKQVTITYNGTAMTVKSDISLSVGQAVFFNENGVLIPANDGDLIIGHVSH